MVTWHVWCKHFVDGLLELWFRQSKDDEYIYYFSSTVFLIFVEYSVLVGPNQNELNRLTKQPEYGFEYRRKVNFMIIRGHKEGSMTLMQLKHIELTLKGSLNGKKENSKGRTTHALEIVLLDKDDVGKTSNKNQFSK
jgi:hypothetical protein